MKRESGSEIRHGRRIFSSTMPVSVARASQWLQKREIAVRQRPPRAAVRHRTYPSAAVCRRFPVFTAVSSLALRVARNALARRIRTANAWFRGSH